MENLGNILIPLLVTVITICICVMTSKVGDSGETAVDNSEEGGDDVKSSCPLRLGLHTCYNGCNKGKRQRKLKQIS